MTDNRLVDVLVFGATGFTGQYVVNKLVKLSKQHGITWGVAGLSAEELKTVLKKSSEKTGEDLSKTLMVLADCRNEGSLKAMAQKTKVIINCVGPFRFYGEPVVKACVENGTHHVDVSGEPQYMETMQLKYHKAAEEKGVYIITACCFAGVPADLGTIFMQKQFEGGCNSVEIFLSHRWFPSSVPFKKTAAHFATWESAVHGLAHRDELRKLRSKLFQRKLPAPMVELQRRFVIGKSEIIKDSWIVPYLTSDKPVALRSQRYFYESSLRRPVQVQVYYATKSFLNALGILILGGLFLLLTMFEFGQKILLKYPGLFSNGYVTHEGPSEEAEKCGEAMLTFHGKGWTSSEKASSSLPDKTVVSNFVIRSPGYGFTSTSVILCALMIVKESENMPSSGGVYPPGYAFANTSLVEELKRNDYKIDIVASKVEPARVC